MNLAIMQPYLFPYLGYYQLAVNSQIFLIHDDAQWIKGGWINRNYILNKGTPVRWTLPVTQGSSTAKINQRYFVPSFDKEIGRLLRLFQEAYKNARYVDQGMAIFESSINHHSRQVSALIVNSINHVFEYLGIDCDLRLTSSYGIPEDYRGQSKVIELCRRAGASSYTNLPGGVELYNASDFAANGIGLQFIESSTHELFPQRPLSIIHELMNFDRQEIKDRLNRFSLIAPKN